MFSYIADQHIFLHGWEWCQKSVFAVGLNSRQKPFWIRFKELELEGFGIFGVENVQKYPK